MVVFLVVVVVVFGLPFEIVVVCRFVAQTISVSSCRNIFSRSLWVFSHARRRTLPAVVRPFFLFFSVFYIVFRKSAWKMEALRAIGSKMKQLAMDLTDAEMYENDFWDRDILGVN